MEDNSPIKEEPVEGSQKLYIIFGGKNVGAGIAPFEFCNASKILNENRVFIRDLSQTWYHMGLPGLSDDIDSTADYLKQLIQRYSPSETILVGNSMGGFAAILFASLVQNCRAIAFAPQTFIGPVKRLKHGERRWRSEIYSTYLKTLFKQKYFDLSQLDAAASNCRADIIVSAGHKRDLAHALNLQHFSQITVHQYAYKKHGIVKYLRDQGELAQILHGNFNPSLKIPQDT
jgi:pimeloyl-ACP methyl ester carboxylesterase